MMSYFSRNVVRGLCAVAALAVSVGMAGCKSDSPPAMDSGDYKDFCSLPKPCQEIAQACHPKDDGSPTMIHECHETGHDVGTLEACSKVHDECLELCNKAPLLDDSGAPVEDLGAHCKKDGGAKDGG